MKHLDCNISDFIEQQLNKTMAIVAKNVEASSLNRTILVFLLLGVFPILIICCRILYIWPGLFDACIRKICCCTPQQRYSKASTEQCESGAGHQGAENEEIIERTELRESDKSNRKE